VSERWTADAANVRTRLFRAGRVCLRQPTHAEAPRLLDKVSKTDSTVLVTGESGTGKELVAKLIHESGPGAARPLVYVNCAALPDTLLESELFGYERGAFTGASRAHAGRSDKPRAAPLCSMRSVR